ncbi:hypothetical protein LWI28_023269 [Acer negundo]|uniref:Uncharacterized protein n=1 Tax=Acer negundo TaxID=4023 RepID=A0AAD5J0U5_ACENE|nr:hypothetical protein LWI28_023269 [Acer negundo]
MKEIRDTWNTFSMDEKSKYTMHKDDIIDEKGYVEEIAKDNNVQSFDIQCTPIRFSQIVSIFSDLQKDAVRELGFSNLLLLKCGFLLCDLCAWLLNKLDTINLSIELHGRSFTIDPSVFSHIMGISDGGYIVNVDGVINDIWRSSHPPTSTGRIAGSSWEMTGLNPSNSMLMVFGCHAGFPAIFAPLIPGTEPLQPGQMGS